MNWEVVSAIGTCLAAFVGIAGIWLNLWDKTKKLNIYFETVPYFKIYISNNSLRATVITKMQCSVKTHVFYVESFEGLQELSVPPATTKNINIIKQDIYDAFLQRKMQAICNTNDEVIITLYDNYGRKYIIKTGLGIGTFEE